MADVTVTPGSVIKSATSILKSGVAGETITAGMSIYVKAADSRLYKTQCDGTAAEVAHAGVALNGGSAGQPINYTTGGPVTIGGTVVVGTLYVVSATFGGIAPITDLVSTNRVTVIGYGQTSSILVLAPILTGVAIP